MVVYEIAVIVGELVEERIDVRAREYIQDLVQNAFRSAVTADQPVMNHRDSRRCRLAEFHQ
jgi:hypothetical protein